MSGASDGPGASASPEAPDGADSGAAGIVYLTPDGDQTLVTVFLADDLVPAPSASPVGR